MNVEYIISFDPGVATGVAIGRKTDIYPLEVIYVGIIQDGLEGVIEWLDETNAGLNITQHDCISNFPDYYFDSRWDHIIVSEKFTPRNVKFVPNIEPARIEGALADRYREIVWQNPSDKTLVGDDFLKRHGLWVTGKKVRHADGRDANDALLHLFAYNLKRKHIPTLECYWKED